jgi:hypothetical protein
MHKFNLHSKGFLVNNLHIGEAESVTESPGAIDIKLRGHEHIIIYAFSRSMFAPSFMRQGVEHFEFSGPRLGLYHDTADMREGPFINHFLQHLSVDIAYQGSQVLVAFNGEADLLHSSIDKYWYKGKKEGIWSFSGEVVYEYFE